MADKLARSSSRLLGHMERGDCPPAFLGMIVNLGEMPFLQLVASDASIAAQLREYVLLPSTRRAITDALFDMFHELEEAAAHDG